VPAVFDLYDLVDGVVLRRPSLTAQEAVANDPGRYTLARPKVWPPEPKGPAFVSDAEFDAVMGREFVDVDEPDPEDEFDAAMDRLVSLGAVDEVEMGTDVAVNGDDLTVIDGIGPALAAKLNDRGIRTFAAVAAMTPEDIAAVEAGPGMKGRASGWIEQAAALAANGD
jgi:predicted flap endonuclease-1-like 5' DNA nuclease